MVERAGRGAAMVKRRAEFARLAKGWIKRNDEVYESEDGRFRAIRREKQTWLLVTDRVTNEREIADCVANLPEVRRRMEAYA